MRKTIKMILLFNATMSYIWVSLFRAVATILCGEDAAIRECQGAFTEFMEEQNGVALLRMFESPVRVTMPDSEPPWVQAVVGPNPITAETVESMPILFEAGPYKLLRQTPPNEHCPFWLYDFTGPGFERNPMGGGYAFIGCTEHCGQSHMGALAQAFAAGHASAPARMEDSCKSR